MYKINEKEIFESLKDTIILELEKIVEFYNSENFVNYLKKENNAKIDPLSFTYHVDCNKEDDGSINYDFKGFKILNSEFNYCEDGFKYREETGFTFFADACLSCETMLPFEIHIYPLEDEINVSFFLYTERNFRKKFKEEFDKKLEQHIQDKKVYEEAMKDLDNKHFFVYKFEREEEIIKEMKERYIKDEKRRKFFNLTDETPTDKEITVFTWNLNKSLSEFFNQVSEYLNNLCSNYKKIEYGKGYW